MGALDLSRLVDRFAGLRVLVIGDVMLDSWQDWRDTNEEHRINGAESEDTYLKLSVPYRSKNGKVDTFFGHSLYTLDCSKVAWKISSKRVVLDMDMLYPGKISIVL